MANYQTKESGSEDRIQRTVEHRLDDIVHSLRNQEGTEGEKDEAGRD
jgi:hypothetical protein